MGARKHSSAIRKRQIAKAVVRLIARQGYDALSVSAVAKQVGIVPSAIYRHFCSKDEMVIYAVDHFQASIFAEWDSVVAAGASPLGILDRLVEIYPSMLPEILVIPRIVFSASARRGKAKVFRHISKNVMVEFLRRLELLFHGGQQAREIDPRHDPQMLAMLFWSMVLPTGIRWYVSGGEFDVAEHLNATWRLIRSSIAMQSPERETLQHQPTKAGRSKR